MNLMNAIVCITVYCNKTYIFQHHIVQLQWLLWLIFTQHMYIIISFTVAGYLK